MEENKVLPLERKILIGIKTTVGAWFQDSNGSRHQYTGEEWVRKDEITELMAGHPNQQPGKSIIVLRGGKTILCEESFNVMVGKMEGR